MSVLLAVRPEVRKNQRSTTTYNMWIAFNEYLKTRLRLNEVTELFSREAYDRLFDSELNNLLAQVDDPRLRDQLADMRGFGWVGYIDRSLRNAGFREFELDELVHQITIQFLINPGGLFRDWSGQPMEFRFRRAVRNAIINMMQKRSTRRRRYRSDELMPDEFAAQATPGDEEAIEAFRQLVQDRLGEKAARLLRLRLAGEETKTFVDSGEATSYSVKKSVKAIKLLAREFARSRNDEDFLAMIEKAMAREADTVKRRFGPKVTA